MSDRSPDIKYLFEPRTIAVVGASYDKSKIGYKILENIVSNGYRGKIYPINPKGGKLLGLPVHTNLDELEDEIDVACIVVPAKLVFEVIQSCAVKGVKFVPVISSGFSEIGNLEMERRVVAYARRNGMRVLGPNIFGFYSATPSLNATFGPRSIPAGNIAIITQSGALGVAMIGKAAVEHMGLSAIISVGNKADIDETDLLEYIVRHNETRVVLMYIEGIKKGERLVKVLKQATRQKPVIVIKSGRSKRGAIAAASHTGSLAGVAEIFDAIMKQCGVLQTDSLQEAFDWCKFLANAPLPAGEHTVIITNGGGVGVMATDACEKYNVDLYDDLHILREAFSGVAPEFGSTKNPIDLTGQATAEHYHLALDAALRNNSIHSVISLYCETALFDVTAFSSMIEKNHDKFQAAKKPVVFSALGGESIEQCTSSLQRQGVPMFSDVYETISCLGALYAHYHRLQKRPEEITSVDSNLRRIEHIIETARKERRAFLLAHEGQELMGVVGIPVPKSHIARTLDEAVRYAEKIGYPVVMKVVSRDIVHKSDVGGVALDLENKNEAIDAYQAILQNCRTHKPDAAIDGIEVSEMASSGTQIIIGARRDNAFGPIAMVGLGGIYVEIMKDISFRALPLDREEAMSMIKEIRSYPLLLGVRGEEKKDIDSVVDAILKIGAIIEQCKNISDIEVNPLVVYEHGQGAKAVDVRVLLSQAKGGTTRE